MALHKFKLHLYVNLHYKCQVTSTYLILTRSFGIQIFQSNPRKKLRNKVYALGRSEIIPWGKQTKFMWKLYRVNIEININKNINYWT